MHEYDKEIDARAYEDAQSSGNDSNSNKAQVVMCPWADKNIPRVESTRQG